MSGVVYDTGALIAADRGNATVWRMHKRVMERGIRPIVISPVLAQAWRDGRKQVLLARFLVGCVVEDFPAAFGYDAGRLLGRSRTSDVVDAAVVVRAAVDQHRIVTSDPDDLRSLGSALGYLPRLEVV